MNCDSISTPFTAPYVNSFQQSITWNENDFNAGRDGTAAFGPQNYCAIPGQGDVLVRHTDNFKHTPIRTCVR